MYYVCLSNDNIFSVTFSDPCLLQQSYSDRQASASKAYVMPLLLSFLFFHLFNDSLEQRGLRNYKADVHEILRGGRHVGIDVQSGIGFAIGQWTLLWQPILSAKSAEIDDTPSFLAGWCNNNVVSVDAAVGLSAYASLT